MHGLFLRVQRITIHGKRCELGLGNPSLASLAKARETAMANRNLAVSGGAPMRAKKEAKVVLTFEDAARKVYALHLPIWRNPKHGAQFLGTLETYTFPRIGALKVADETTADVLGELMPIWTAKTETAAPLRQRIVTAMKWAIAQGGRQDNPAQTIDQTRQEPTATPQSPDL